MGDKNQIRINTGTLNIESRIKPYYKDKKWLSFTVNTAKLNHFC